MRLKSLLAQQIPFDRPSAFVGSHAEGNNSSTSLLSPSTIISTWCYLRVRIHNVTGDSDFACGIISKDSRLAHLADFYPDAALASLWRTLDLSQKYPFFDENRSRLLRLISTEEFRRRLIGEFKLKGCLFSPLSVRIALEFRS